MPFPIQVQPTVSDKERSMKGLIASSNPGEIFVETSSIGSSATMVVGETEKSGKQLNINIPSF